MENLYFIEKTIAFINSRRLRSKNGSSLIVISEFLTELFDVDYVLINKYSKASPNWVESIVVYGNGNCLPNMKYELKGTPCENVVNKSLCIYEQGIQTQFPKDNILQELQAEGYIGLPLWNSVGDPIGLIALLTKDKLVNTESIGIVLEIIAIKVAQLLEDDIRKIQFQSQKQSFKKSEFQRLSIEKKYATLVENTNDGIIIYKNDKIIFSNTVADKELGYKNGGLIGKDALDFVPKKYHKAIRIRILARYSGRNVPKITEIELINKKNKNIPVEISTSVISINEEKALLIFIRNISRRKSSEMALQKKHKELIQLTHELSEKNRLLRESQDNFKNVFERSPISLWVEDFSNVKKLLDSKKLNEHNLTTYLDDNPEFFKKCISNIKVLAVNQRTLDLFGVGNKDELLQHLQKTNNEKSYAVLKREFLTIAAGEDEFIDKAEYVDTNGKTINTIIKSAKDQSGKTIVSLIDVTASTKAKNELKLAKKKIEKSEKKFRELYEKSTDATLIMKNGIFVDCNEAAVQMLSYSKKSDLLNCSPADISPTMQHDGIRSDIKEKQFMQIVMKNGNHRFEWLHTKSDGEVFPVEVALTIISNEPDNEVIHVVWRDITLQKLAEQKLIDAKK